MNPLPTIRALTGLSVAATFSFGILATPVVAQDLPTAVTTDPAEAVFIDDVQANVRAARSVGLQQALHFTSATALRRSPR